MNSVFLKWNGAFTIRMKTNKNRFFSLWAEQFRQGVPPAPDDGGMFLLAVGLRCIRNRS